MLMKTHGLTVDQLLTDLMAVRERLSDPRRWLKGGFHSSVFNSVCIMAAVNEVTEQKREGFTAVPVGNEDAKLERAGRLTFQIYTTLYGPHADTDITVTRAAHEIARFNDDDITTHESVLLLLDRAIAELLAPVTVEA